MYTMRLCDIEQTSTFDKFKEYFGITNTEPFIETMYDFFKLSSINYDRFESFANYFKITFKNITPYYVKKYNYYNTLLNMNDYDIMKVQKNISKYAETPNVLRDTNYTDMYTTNESQQIVEGNRYDAYMKFYKERLENVSEEYIEEFKKHFTLIYNVDEYFIQGV